MCISVHLHLERDQGRRSFTTSVVSSNSFDLFFSVLVCMQEQQNCSKTWHIDTKIVSNGISKISFCFYVEKKTIFLFIYIMFWYRDFQARCEKLSCEKWKIDHIFRIRICLFKPWLSLPFHSLQLPVLSAVFCLLHVKCMYFLFKSNSLLSIKNQSINHMYSDSSCHFI